MEKKKSNKKVIIIAVVAVIVAAAVAVGIYFGTKVTGKYELNAKVYVDSASSTKDTKVVYALIKYDTKVFKGEEIIKGGSVYLDVQRTTYTNEDDFDTENVECKDIYETVSEIEALGLKPLTDDITVEKGEEFSGYFVAKFEMKLSDKVQDQINGVAFKSDCEGDPDGIKLNNFEVEELENIECKDIKEIAEKMAKDKESM